MTKQTVYRTIWQDKADLECSFWDSMPFKLTTIGEDVSTDVSLRKTLID